MKFEVVMPLLGFEDIKEVELEKIDDVFMSLRSTRDEHISFTLINPFILREYDFELPKTAQIALGASKESNLLILNIVLIQTPIEESVVNFAGPLVFNTDNNKAAQIVLSDQSFPVAQRISSFITK